MIRPLPFLRDAFVRDERGSSAAEFGLVLPLLLILLLGILDTGRFMWEYNEAEKATQMGARYAVVTKMALGDSFRNYSFATGGGVLAGTAVPLANFEVATCDTSACSCTGSACGQVTYDAAAFDAIVARMRYFYPSITDSNVRVEYRNVGLGYAGDPSGPDVEPLVTVSLTGMRFQPLSSLIVGRSVTMPDFRASLTLEDGTGTVGN